MAQILQHRRATTIELAAERGSAGEFWMDESKNTLVVMDGSTLGGHPLAKSVDIPVNVSQLNNDAGYITSAAVFSGDYADLTGKPDLSVYQLSASAFSGAYADLTGKPTIPSTVSELTNDSQYQTLASIESSYGLDIRNVGGADKIDVSSFFNDIGYVTNTFMTNAINASIASKIELTDITVGTENTPSGDGAISYNNTTGEFKYTPADMSSYLTSVSGDPAPQLQNDLIANNVQIKSTVDDVVLNPSNELIVLGNTVINGTLDATGGVTGYISVSSLKSIAASANTYSEFQTAIANL